MRIKALVIICLSLMLIGCNEKNTTSNSKTENRDDSTSISEQNDNEIVTEKVDYVSNKESEEEKKEREKSDLEVIEELKNAGSDISKLHYIEHHFIVENQENIIKMSDDLKKEGYEVSEVYEELDEEGKKYFFFDGFKACMIESNVIFEETRIMTEIVLSYNEIYDGWGTNIVK